MMGNYHVRFREGGPTILSTLYRGPQLARYYGGCAHTMPIFCILFCIFTMANIALPLTANFVGEFLIFQGAFCNNTLVACLGATSMILSGGYSLLAYGRVAYGACKPHFIRRCAVKAIISSLGNYLGAQYTRPFTSSGQLRSAMYNQCGQWLLFALAARGKFHLNLGPAAPFTFSAPAQPDSKVPLVWCNKLFLLECGITIHSPGHDGCLF